MGSNTILFQEKLIPPLVIPSYGSCFGPRYHLCFVLWTFPSVSSSVFGVFMWWVMYCLCGAIKGFLRKFAQSLWGENIYRSPVLDPAHSCLSANRFASMDHCALPLFYGAILFDFCSNPPFEIHDSAKDQIDLGTIPQLIGLNKTRWLGAIILFIAFGLKVFVFENAKKGYNRIRYYRNGLFSRPF